MSAKSVGRLDWRTLFQPKDGLPPETVKTFDSYFECFAQPPMTVDADGKNNIGNMPCLKCGKDLLGLASFMLGGGFTWGLAHGEGFCVACKWPARAHHFIKDEDGKDVITLRNVILQYHPDFVTKRKSKAEAAA